MKQVRNIIEKKLEKQVIILGSNDNSIFGMFVGDKNRLSYFSASINKDQKINRIQTIELDDKSIRDTGDYLHLVGYFGDSDAEETNWNKFVYVKKAPSLRKPHAGIRKDKICRNISEKITQEAAKKDEATKDEAEKNEVKKDTKFWWDVFKAKFMNDAIQDR
jgi:hypothetical protein